MQDREFYSKIGSFLGKIVAEFHEVRCLLRKKRRGSKLDSQFRKNHPFNCVIDVRFNLGTFVPDEKEPHPQAKPREAVKSGNQITKSDV